jgi:hypothetical protein
MAGNLLSILITVFVVGFGIMMLFVVAMAFAVSDEFAGRFWYQRLARQGLVPRDLPGFLEFADRRILLSSVGSGYMFMPCDPASE